MPPGLSTAKADESACPAIRRTPRQSVRLCRKNVRTLRLPRGVT